MYTRSFSSFIHPQLSTHTHAHRRSLLSRFSFFFFFFISFLSLFESNLYPLSANYPGTTAEHPLEGLPELWWKYRVYHRVQGAVEVAQPQEDACHQLRWLAGLARGTEQRDQEERQPTGNERPGDYRQRFRRFPLAFRLDRFACPLARRRGRVAARRVRHGGGRGGRGRRYRRRCHGGRLGGVRAVVRRWLLRRDWRMVRRGSRYGERRRLLPRPEIHAEFWSSGGSSCFRPFSFLLSENAMEIFRSMSLRKCVVFWLENYTQEIISSILWYKI